MSRVSAVESAVTALQAQRLSGTTGSASSSATLLAGGTRTVAVTFASALPDTNYTVIAQIDGAQSLLGTIAVQYPITARTTTGCTVTIKNVGLATIAQAITVQVTAIRLGA
ncbi:hypothetical protein ACFVFF_23330 [Streptomyces sp. NPDC057680]|uniref:hypothetical protein n=1 Tax=Streptomyces sp. NPDC057680 TaxID=3346208 RepID=UPI0036B9D2F6